MEWLLLATRFDTNCHAISNFLLEDIWFGALNVHVHSIGLKRRIWGHRFATNTPQAREFKSCNCKKLKEAWNNCEVGQQCFQNFKTTWLCKLPMAYRHRSESLISFQGLSLNQLIICSFVRVLFVKSDGQQIFPETRMLRDWKSKIPTIILELTCLKGGTHTIT